MITLRCLVDNCVLRGSGLWGEHGVSFLIDAPGGRLLFDTGQSGDVFAHNTHAMGIDLSVFDALAISHAHYDHTGGLGALMNVPRRSKIPLYAHSDLFRERYALGDGVAHSIGLRLSHEELAEMADLRLSAEPVQIFAGIWTSGEIIERPEFLGSSPRHMIQEKKDFIPDPYRDDLSLVLETASGLVVVCGCCHAGLLNTLLHVNKVFKRDVRAIVGGAHLADVSEDSLERTVALLPQLCNGVPNLYLNHCSGERAISFLGNAFPGKVQPCPAGAGLSFE